MSARSTQAPSLTALSRSTPPHASVAPAFVGTHPAHLAALHSIESFAPFEDATVLIEGESGTGKSFAARLLHQCSPRAREIFHPLTLSTLDDNIAASDLFGHLSGSYTDARQNRPGHFVTANRGTLFLDEIGKASAAVQRKLLHAIEHKEITPVGADRAVRLDVRLVAATNIPLETLIARGTMLEDLAARIMHFRVRLPALRERRKDIPALVRQFVGLRAATYGHPLRPPKVHPDLMEALCGAKWPYNLRELDGVMRRLMVEAAVDGKNELSLKHCIGDLSYLRKAGGKSRMPTPALVRERMEVLKSKTKVAASLEISRWTVHRYLKTSAPQAATKSH